MSVEDTTLAAAGVTATSRDQARKRRRWSTVQEDLMPTRFGGKLRNSGHLDALASFQSLSNPMFEPAPSLSPVLDRSRAGLRVRTRVQSQLSKRPGLTVPSKASIVKKVASTVGQHHVSARRFRSQKNSHLEPPVIEDGNWKRLQDLMKSDSVFLPSSAFEANEESRRNSIDSSNVVHTCNDGDLHVVKCHLDNVALPAASPEHIVSEVEITNTKDGQFTRDICLPEEQDCLESCSRRTRELVEDVQAHALEELSKLRSYKAVIDQLRADLDEHELSKQRSVELHAAARKQLVSVLDGHSNFMCGCDAQKRTKDKFKPDYPGTEERVDKTVLDWKMKLEGMTIERDYWKQQAQRLERKTEGLFPATMSRIGGFDTVTCNRAEKPSVVEADRDALFQGDEDKLVIEDPQLDSVHFKIGDVSALNKVTEQCILREQSEHGIEDKLSSEMLSRMRGEYEARLSTVQAEMDKLEKERDDLVIAVQKGEKRVEDVEKDRDAVCLAVQSEWKSVQDALQNQKDSMNRELLAVLDEKTKLKAELNAARFVAESNSRALEIEQDRVRKLQSERDSLAISNEEVSKKLKEEKERLEKMVRDLTASQETSTKLKEERERLEKLVRDLTASQEASKKLREERDRLDMTVRDLTAALSKEQNDEACSFADENKKPGVEVHPANEKKKKLGSGQKKRVASYNTRSSKQETKLETPSADKDERQKLGRDEDKKVDEREILIAMQAFLETLEAKKSMETRSRKNLLNQQSDEKKESATKKVSTIPANCLQLQAK